MKLRRGIIRKICFSISFCRTNVHFAIQRGTHYEQQENLKCGNQHPGKGCGDLEYEQCPSWLLLQAPWIRSDVLPLRAKQFHNCLLPARDAV